MSRYIDKDSAIDLSISVLCGGGNEEMAVLVEDINSAPSIDICFCRECKYWKESQYYPEVMVCTYVKGATFTRQHDDFCSRGERESE